MKKGFSAIFTALLLGAMTLVVGVGGSEILKDAERDCSHNVTVLLRDINSGLLFMELEANQNVSVHLKYQQMPETMSFQTDEDIAYWRDDGKIVLGLMSYQNLKNFMGCNKNV